MDSTHPSPSLPTASHLAVRWGSLTTKNAHGVHDGALPAMTTMLRQQNQHGGFAWSPPTRPKRAELCADGADPTVLRWMALGSERVCDNTGLPMDEHFRRIWDARKLLFMHPQDMVARGLVEGDLAHVTTVSSDSHSREMAGMRVVPFDLPRGSVGGYFPECNPLLAVTQHTHQAPQPAASNIQVRVKSATA